MGPQAPNAEEAGFLAAIIANPADDTARLVYADWLQDRGDEARAEFIRAGCEIARLCELHLSGAATAADTARQRLLFEREGELSRDVYPRVVHPLFQWLTSLGIDYSHCVFNRGGWLAAVTCEARAWLRHGELIRRQQPVSEVRLTTRPAPAEIDFKRLWNTFGQQTCSAWVAGRTVQTGPLAEGEEPLFELLERRWPGVRFQLPYPFDRPMPSTH